LWLAHHPSWLACVALLALALFALGACTSSGGPMRLDNQVTDQVGALDGRTDEVDAALGQLREETGIQLFVVFVDSFGGTPAQDWADQTAVKSDLGARDALLNVATRDRAYAYSVDQNFPLTNAQLDQVAATAIEPALAQNDWAGAVIGAADGYRAVLAGRPVSPPAIVPGDANPSRRSAGIGGFGLLCFLVPLIGVAVAVGVLIWSRSRSRAGTPHGPAVDPNDPFPGVPTQTLNDRANTLLVEMDDALRTSERELGLATADYGAEATAGFTAALESARADVAEAFRLRMELESSSEPAGRVPHEPETRRKLAEIIRRCEAADARLDAEADAFRELRQLDLKLEELVPSLGERRAGTEGRLTAASAEVADLQTRFNGPALAAVAGNPGQAKERLAFAASALTRAGESLSAGKRPPATLAVRAAEQALDQADALLTAIGKVGADLLAAKDAVRTLLVEVDSDLAAGRAATASPAPGSAPPGAPPAPTLPPATMAALAAAIAATEEAAAAARTALEASTMDPLAELRRLREADDALDRALGEHRGAVERVTRAAAMLPQAILAARAEISAAGDFITTRRGAVGGRARTLLAEAQRHLSQAEALTESDPVTALAEAQQADQLAEQAAGAARSDVDQWSATGSGGWGTPGGISGGGFGGSGGMDGLAGAVLGGILLGGSRRRHGGYGGGFGGSFGGGGFGGGRRGGGGSFGGGFGGRSGGRRGGGGRF
jgi:uncharacterized membrane protein YgcG